MKTRKLGPYEVSAIGLGCMSLSHAYGTPPSREAAGRLLERALELGCTHFDTAAVYGFGANETLIGEVLGHRRDAFTLASKCGLFRDQNGKREIDGRPQALKRTCEDSLKRLGTDRIDLYYLHRWDKKVPVEDSIGALADLVRKGKIGHIGMSEVSAATLRRAHAVHPITALQSEYSLWSRNAEIATLDACRELGISYVAFSPLARAFLTGKLRDVSVLEPRDIRRNMPRFAPETYAKNLKLLDGLADIAADAGCTMAQLALAWLLAKDERIVPIPGTTSLAHLEENLGAADVELSGETVARLEALFDRHAVAGRRYTDATLQEVDTEEFETAG